VGISKDRLTNKLVVPERSRKSSIFEDL